MEKVYKHELLEKFISKKEITESLNRGMIKMAKKNSIKLFEDKLVRSVWDEEKEEWYKCLYYKHLLKDNINLLSDKEIKELNNNWLNSNDMINLCDKYNIEYKTIHFRQ